MKTTHLIIALNVLIFVAMLAVAGTGQLSQFSNETLVKFGANYGPLVMTGQWWRLPCSMFIHVSPIHLGMNMLALYQCGMVLEPHFGRWRYVLVYVLAGLAGAAASVAWNWHSPVVSAGASGAIAGLIGAGAVAGHLIGNTSAIRFRDSMLMWVLSMFAFGFFFHVDNAAHAGGLLAGAAVAWLIDRGGAALIQRPYSNSPGVETALVIALVGVSFGLASRAQNDALTIEQLVNRGVESSRAGKIDEAIADYRRALEMSPHESIAHFDLGLALLHKEQYPEAAVEMRRAVESDPKNRSAFVVLAQLEEQLGHHEAAEAAHRSALALGPDEPLEAPTSPAP